MLSGGDLHTSSRRGPEQEGKKVSDRKPFAIGSTLREAELRRD
jgi:hypothetical protein